MTTAHFSSARLSLLALAAAALLSACGGGQSDPAEAGAREFVGQIARLHPMSAAARESAQAITIGQVDAKALFDWAEYKLPSLFPKTPAPQNIPSLSFQGNTYAVRAYGNGNFLGLRNDGAVFGLGPFTGGALTQFGRLSDYAAAVVAEQCQVNPANCAPTNQPTGPVNECMTPAAQALATGNRIQLSYISYTTSPAAPTAELTIDAVVIGSATFEGRSAVRTDSVLRGTSNEFGVAGTFETRSKDYAQVADNGLILDLGSEDEITFSGGGQSFVSSSKTVFNAGGLNNEFALQLGQSFTKSVTTTNTSFLPFPSGPTTGTTTETHTFEGKETISVLAGTFNTCRYREVIGSDTTINWYIVGRGIAARSRSVTNGVTTTQELRSGTVNGGPL